MKTKEEIISNTSGGVIGHKITARKECYLCGKTKYYSVRY